MPAAPNQQPRNVTDDYATIRFVVEQLFLGVATSTPVRVMACTNAGDIVPVGTVDVQLLVDQVTGDGQTIPHGTVFKAPYQRYQGGKNAVIIDPEPGDIGVCVFASRDISAVKADPDAARNRQPSAGATPGSRRTFSLSDAMYVASILNPVPDQLIQFNSDGIRVISPTLVRVEAPNIELVATETITVQAPDINLKGNVHQTEGDVDMSGNLDVQGDITTPGEVTAGNIGLTTHKHPTAPTGPISEPIP